MKSNFFRRGFRRFNRELADEFQLVLNIDFEIVRAQNGFGHAKYLMKFPGGETMFHVIGMPCLQAAQSFRAKSTAAVDESLFDARHVADVRVSRDGVAVGQNKAKMRGGMLAQHGF